ncbi:hypothetical protein K474DRAFT_1660870 [Panus rudis PR-1116 ss-1]|nr:hypothetical protein K474DRAFT_1660870 [Panus rudis PR-1116 ss-1]
MPNVRCMWFDPDGKPRRGGCRRQDCAFVHPTDTAWLSAQPSHRNPDQPPPNRGPRGSGSSDIPYGSMDSGWGSRGRKPSTTPRSLRDGWGDDSGFQVASTSKSFDKPSSFPSGWGVPEEPGKDVEMAVNNAWDNLAKANKDTGGWGDTSGWGWGNVSSSADTWGLSANSQKSDNASASDGMLGWGDCVAPTLYGSEQQESPTKSSPWAIDSSSPTKPDPPASAWGWGSPEQSESPVKSSSWAIASSSPSKLNLPSAPQDPSTPSRGPAGSEPSSPMDMDTDDVGRTPTSPTSSRDVPRSLFDEGTYHAPSYRPRTASMERPSSPTDSDVSIDARTEWTGVTRKLFYAVYFFGKWKTAQQQHEYAKNLYHSESFRVLPRSAASVRKIHAIRDAEGDKVIHYKEKLDNIIDELINGEDNSERLAPSVLARTIAEVVDYRDRVKSWVEQVEPIVHNIVQTNGELASFGKRVTTIQGRTKDVEDLANNLSKLEMLEIDRTIADQRRELFELLENNVPVKENIEFLKRLEDEVNAKVEAQIAQLPKFREDLDKVKNDLVPAVKKLSEVKREALHLRAENEALRETLAELSERCNQFEETKAQTDAQLAEWRSLLDEITNQPPLPPPPDVNAIQAIVAPRVLQNIQSSIAEIMEGMKASVEQRTQALEREVCSRVWEEMQTPLKLVENVQQFVEMEKRKSVAQRATVTVSGQMMTTTT